MVLPFFVPDYFDIWLDQDPHVSGRAEMSRHTRACTPCSDEGGVKTALTVPPRLAYEVEVVFDVHRPTVTSLESEMSTLPE